MIYGLPLQDMPERWTPLDAVAVVSCLDENGETAMLLRASEELRVWDTVGMLQVALDSERARAQDSFVADDDDADEE